MTTGELKHIQNGDTVSVRGVVQDMTDDNVLVMFKLKSGQKTIDWVSRDVVGAAYALPPSPKYDPCRLYKKGDIVTTLARDGREVPGEAPVGEKCTVVAPEKNGIVRIHYVAGSVHFIHELPFYHLELVTPAEELEPYSVEVDDDEWHILRGGKFLMSFPFDSDAYYTEEQAKAAAEAECGRLNAKYRKEKA